MRMYTVQYKIRAQTAVITVFQCFHASLKKQQQKITVIFIYTFIKSCSVSTSEAQESYQQLCFIFMQCQALRKHLTCSIAAQTHWTTSEHLKHLTAIFHNFLHIFSFVTYSIIYIFLGDKISKILVLNKYFLFKTSHFIMFLNCAVNAKSNFNRNTVNLKAAHIKKFG